MDMVPNVHLFRELIGQYIRRKRPMYLGIQCKLDWDWLGSQICTNVTNPKDDSGIRKDNYWYDGHPHKISDKPHTL